MKQSEFLETWQDFVDIFGPGVALKLKPLGNTLWALVRLPSRTGWQWRRVRVKRKPANLRVVVTLEDDERHDIVPAKR